MVLPGGVHFRLVEGRSHEVRQSYRPSSPTRGIKCLSSGLFQVDIMDDLLPNAWSRVQLYASWMCKVHMCTMVELAEDTFKQLCLNAPANRWFPRLQCLRWEITRKNISHYDMFFSPGLKSICISTKSPWNPNGILPAGKFHPAGPSRTLESGELVTTFTHSSPIIPWTDVRDFLSSKVL